MDVPVPSPLPPSRASQLVIRASFGQLPFAASAGNNAGMPFVGLLARSSEHLRPPTAAMRCRLLSLLFVLG